MHRSKQPKHRQPARILSVSHNWNIGQWIGLSFWWHWSVSHEIGNWPRGGSTSPNVSQDSQRSVNTFISHHSTAASRQNVEVEDQIQFCPKPGQAGCSCCLWTMGSLRWAPQVSNGQDKRAMGTTEWPPVCYGHRSFSNAGSQRTAKSGLAHNAAEW